MSSLMDKMQSVHPVHSDRLTVHRLLLHKALQFLAWQEFSRYLHHKYCKMSGDIYRYVNYVQSAELKTRGCTRKSMVGWTPHPLPFTIVWKRHSPSHKLFDVNLAIAGQWYFQSNLYTLGLPLNCVIYSCLILYYLTPPSFDSFLFLGPHTWLWFLLFFPGLWSFKTIWDSSRGDHGNTNDTPRCWECGPSYDGDHPAAAGTQEVAGRTGSQTRTIQFSTNQGWAHKAHVR